MLFIARRPPPGSTLFPYTTLFRSGAVPRPRARRGLRGPRTRLRAGGRRAGSDRKSTRLNSSHVEISYAVFCLKKKSQLHYAIVLGQQHPRRFGIDLWRRPAHMGDAVYREAPTARIYTLSLHDALPIWGSSPTSRASRTSRTAYSTSCWRSAGRLRSEEHTSELQSRRDLVCRLLLEKKKSTALRNSPWAATPTPFRHRPLAPSGAHGRCCLSRGAHRPDLHSFPTRRSSDLGQFPDLARVEDFEDRVLDFVLEVGGQA